MTAPERLGGVDVGEVNAAAVVTGDGDALVISGRKLRASKRLFVGAAGAVYGGRALLRHRLV